MHDHVLFARSVLTPEGVRPAAVHIHGERIVAVTAEAPPNATDLGDAVLMPSLVDCHVHINEPGRTQWEGFETATRAAATGGITTLVDMPLNSIPVTTSPDALAAKLAATSGKLHVDCGFWGGVVPGNTPHLRPMVEAGVLGFKAFTCDSGIDDFPASSEHDLRLAMTELARLGVPLLVHAELVTELEAAAQEPATDYASWLHSRPASFEVAAIAMVLDLVRETGCRAHIVHLSAADALPMLREAKRQGLPITVETCPHYLCLASEQIPPRATEYKCAPPIRPSDNQARLWHGLADGTIDFVISDHSPCVPALKLPERGDFLEAWGGIASLQLGLPNIWTHASRRGFTLQDVYGWMSKAPAGFLGLADRGIIRPGARADLVAWQPETPWTITPELLQQRHRITPYIGHEVRGQVRSTWLRGHQIVHEGRPCGDPRGQILRCHHP